VSNNANSERDNDKFFRAGREDDKPKAPGSFTRSFMGSGTETEPSVPEPAPKSPIPFTAQFGSSNVFSPAPESARPSSVSERVSGSSQPTASGGSFTKMFASEAPASQPSDPPLEVTRVFDRPPREAMNSSLPQTSRSSGFTEMFGSTESAAPVSGPKQPAVTPAPFQSNPGGFTELFKPAPPAQATSAAQQPLSPLSAQPGTGRFTELFKGESISREAPPAAPTPFSSSGAGGFTEFFKTPSVSAQPAPTPPPTLTPAESAPGGFTQLFKGSVAPKPSPVSPKPAGELTQMISGSGLTPAQSAESSSAAPQAGATRLFTGGTDAPAMAPLPAGPSEYTRIVSPRQLKDLQSGAPAMNNAASAASAGQMPGIPSIPGVTPMPAPQLTVPPVTSGAPWQAPQVQVQQPAPYTWQPPQVPSVPTAFPPAPAPPVAPKAESKILTYLPLIIGLNVLFLIAVLLILLFALKR
jgi:hypothetical protein